MSINDKELLTWYFKGFNDELRGRSRDLNCADLEKKAYSIGAFHAKLGDDVPSIDYMRDSEVLELIKN